MMMVMAVEGGHRAVVFDRFKGVLPKPLLEGTSIIIPFIQVGYSSARGRIIGINVHFGTMKSRHR